MPTLLETDDDEVVPQELETSIEVMVRVLRHFLVADDEVGHLPGRALRAYREGSASCGSTASASHPVYSQRMDHLAMRGCSLLVDPGRLIVSATMPTSSAGAVDVDLPLPTCPVLVRGTFCFQWACLAPGANPLGALATRGLRVTILP